MKVNARWHHDNPMPDNPTKKERLMWYLAHQKYCACRAMPKNILKELEQR